VITFDFFDFIILNCTHYHWEPAAHACAGVGAPGTFKPENPKRTEKKRKKKGKKKGRKEVQCTSDINTKSTYSAGRHVRFGQSESSNISQGKGRKERKRKKAVKHGQVWNLCLRQSRRRHSSPQASLYFSRDIGIPAGLSGYQPAWIWGSGYRNIGLRYFACGPRSRIWS
jgi:hypothetical protein